MQRRLSNPRPFARSLTFVRDDARFRCESCGHHGQSAQCSRIICTISIQLFFGSPTMLAPGGTAWLTCSLLSPAISFFCGLLSAALSIFRVWEGGMSSHGGMLGLLLFTLYYAQRHKISWTNLGDNLVVTAPIGLFFGRCANFINGELYGRITNL